MKLIKEKHWNRGYIITVLISNRYCSSWWSAPSIPGVDNFSGNFDMEYLKGRYSCINTRLKAQQFSSLYKNLWIEVSEKQLELMKHALGLNYKKKPYRNYFFTQKDDTDWNDLVFKGLAGKSKKEPDSHNCIYFWLSKQGVEYVLGKSVSEKVYQEL